MISLVFRIALIVCSILTTVFMIKKIRNSKLQIEHAIFWLMFAFLLIVISLFPQLTIWGAKLLGILFIVIIKLFMATIEISNLEYRIKELSQKIAIDEKFEADSNDKDQKDSQK